MNRSNPIKTRLTLILCIVGLVLFSGCSAGLYFGFGERHHHDLPPGQEKKLHDTKSASPFAPGRTRHYFHHPGH